jgi:RNA 2',3'-cyclic 3'-phosphodiesterase
MRLFIGIPLAATTERDLAAEVMRLQASKRNPALPDNFRWSARESWHITLQFLGSTSPEQYECVSTRLRELRHPQVHIELRGLGTIPRAGVLIVGVLVTPELTALQQAVTAATSPCGFRPEDRPYHPHITLARKKGKHGDKNFYNLKVRVTPPHRFINFTADSFLLYESIPTPEGSRYEVRERFPLTA